MNFTNLSRYSELDEKTYRRQFVKDYDFERLNAHCIEQSIPQTAIQIAAMDCSYIRKSGKHSYGLGHFYNGSAGRAEKGLEVSLISIVDIEASIGYGLSLEQTPSNGGLKQPNKSTSKTEITRIDHYLKQLQSARKRFPKFVKYLALDCFYSKTKFVNGTVALDLEVIGKLRIDANLRYLYTGVQKPRGAKRKYDGKVNLSQHDRLTYVTELQPQVKLFTATVWHVSLKRIVRIGVLVDETQPGKVGHALLFSTDLNLSAFDLWRFYKARFEIEFIFRDAKQFTGLSDCQARDSKKLHFHFNAAISALNIAKCQAHQEHLSSDDAHLPFVFSMASFKRRALNAYLLDQFIAMLDLDPTLIKSHPNFHNLCSIGTISS